MAQELTKENFKQAVAGPMTLVDFWAPWCSPCKIMFPILDELETEFAGQIKFTRLNVDNNQDLAKEYKVMGLPSYVLFENGKGVEKVTGIYPKEKLAHYLKRKLKDASN